MAQQLHHSPYEMVVIVPIAIMKFLPIMKTGMRAPAARETRRSLMRKGAGKSVRKCRASVYLREEIDAGFECSSRPAG
jgi:hypothetical protein